ncbi:MAG: DUF3566 domain-containing protein [Mycobacterium sp.]
MSSPNEPGPPRTGESPGATNGSNGAHEGVPSGSGTGSGAPGEGVPPWQRGTARSRPSRPGEGQPHEGPRPDGPRPDGPRPDGPRPDGPRPDGPRPEGSRSGAPTGHSPGTDARLNRFIAGGPAASPSASTPTPTPAREPTPARDPEPAAQPARNERPEPTRPETYASELPDLSGGTPRARKPGTERTSGTEAPARPVTRSQAGSRSQGPVRASMQVRRFDPWSVLKVSLVLSVALFFVWMIAIAFLYLVLGGMGVWSKLNSNVGDLLTSASGSGGELVSSGTIFGGAALIGLVNIVLLTAMATCGAFIYNLTTDLVGGIEVTLADRD